MERQARKYLGDLRFSQRYEEYRLLGCYYLQSQNMRRISQKFVT
jgi:hypothetical protein